jgi:hypothetical protein
MTDEDKILALLDTFFRDRSKSRKWLDTPNLLLGGMEPSLMIKIGQSDRLHKLIRNWLDDNKGENDGTQKNRD